MFPPISLILRFFDTRAHPQLYILISSPFNWNNVESINHSVWHDQHRQFMRYSEICDYRRLLFICCFLCWFLACLLSFTILVNKVCYTRAHRVLWLLINLSLYVSETIDKTKRNTHILLPSQIQLAVKSILNKSIVSHSLENSNRFNFPFAVVSKFLYFFHSFRKRRFNIMRMRSPITWNISDRLLFVGGATWCRQNRMLPLSFTHWNI